MNHALQVFKDPEDQQFHWVVLEEHPDESGVFTPHSGGETGFATYSQALLQGALALTMADAHETGNGTEVGPSERGI